MKTKITIGLILFVALSFAEVVTWETFLREPAVAMFDEEVATSTPEVTEETRIEYLMQTKRAMDAGLTAQENEAKKMRLEEIAEEAKELQAEMDDPSL